MLLLECLWSQLARNEIRYSLKKVEVCFPMTALGMEIVCYRDKDGLEDLCRWSEAI